MALEFIAGGAAGGWFGMKLALAIAGKRRTLSYLFAAVIFVVAIYMLARTGIELAG